MVDLSRRRESDRGRKMMWVVVWKKPAELQHSSIERSPSHSSFHCSDQMEGQRAHKSYLDSQNLLSIAHSLVLHYPALWSPSSDQRHNNRGFTFT